VNYYVIDQEFIPELPNAVVPAFHLGVSYIVSKEVAAIYALKGYFVRRGTPDQLYQMLEEQHDEWLDKVIGTVK